MRVMNLSRYIPIVTQSSIEIFDNISRQFSYAIIPYYTITDVLGLKKKLAKTVTFILSSIMPDEYLLQKDTYKQFIDTARKLNIKYVIVWDLPTYLNNKDESLKNVYLSIKYVKYFINEGFNIIPLVKGAYPEHIKVSASEIYDLGFNIVAFHVSEYLYSEEKPWPYINDYSLTAIDLMMLNINEILKYDFDEILLIGGASPRYYKTLMEIDDRIKLSGFSWYIDAYERKLYLNTGDIVDIKFKYYECSCQSCIEVPPSLRRRPRYIARHNLLINKYLIEESENEVTISFYDLIMEPHEDAIIAAELYVGHKDSIWKKLLTWIKEIKPSYIIFIGPTFYKRWSKYTFSEWSSFIKELTELYSKYNTKAILVADPTERKPPLQTEPDAVYPPSLDPRNDALKETKYDDTIIKVSRLLCKVKSSIKIKKYDSLMRPVTIEVSVHKPAEKSIESALEDLRGIKKRTDWLISNYINQPTIDKEYKIATPGVWRATWLFYTKPVPGAIYITRNGEIRLHVF